MAASFLQLHRGSKVSIKQNRLRRQLRLENLESRKLLAGNVTDLTKAFPLDVYEGDAGYFPVAKFTSDSGSTPDDFAAVVEWQDGVKNIGFVTAVDSGFMVSAARHFENAASLNYTVNVFSVVTDTPIKTTLFPLPTAEIHSRATDQIASSITPVAVNINVQQGEDVAATVLEFTDNQLGRSIAGYSATIQWPGHSGALGDASQATITQIQPGRYKVTAKNPVWFTSVFSGFVEVNVQYAGIESVSGRSPLLVGATSITNIVTTPMLQVSTSGGLTEYFDGKIGSFTIDPTRPIDAKNLWAMVQWGDGAQQVSLDGPDIRIVPNPASLPDKQIFDVYGKHKYVLLGAFSVSVDIFEYVPGRPGAPLSRAKITNSITINQPTYVEPRAGYSTGWMADSCYSATIAGGAKYNVEITPEPIQVIPKTLFGTAGVPLSGSVNVSSTPTFMSGNIYNWGDSPEFYNRKTLSPYDTSFTHTYDRPGSYSINSHLNYHFNLPDYTGYAGCTIDRNPVAFLNIPVEIEAPDVLLTINPQLSSLFTRGQTITASQVLSGASGLMNWTIATIEWGEGTIGLFEYDNGTWRLLAGEASHTYDFLGSRFIRASILSDTKVASDSVVLNVPMPAPQNATMPLAPLALSTSDASTPNSIQDPILVGRFSDSNPRHIGGAHSTQVVWPLGNDGEVADLKAITGTNGLNAYAKPSFLAPGAYSAELSTKDQLDELTWSSGVLVKSQDISLTALPVQVGFDAAREDVPLAKFTVANAKSIPAEGYRATIAWGDGTRGVGKVVKDPSSDGFLVIGKPLYQMFVPPGGEYSKYVARTRDYIARVTVQDGAATGVAKSVDIPITIGQATAGVMSKTVVLGNYELRWWVQKDDHTCTAIGSGSSSGSGSGSSGSSSGGGSSSASSSGSGTATGPCSDSWPGPSKGPNGLQLWDENWITWGDGSHATWMGFENTSKTDTDPLFNAEDKKSPTSSHWYLRDSSEGAIQTSSTLWNKSTGSPSSLFVADSLIYDAAVVPLVVNEVGNASSKTLLYFNTSENSQSLSASVDWGDGTDSAASVVSLANGMLSVVGNHAYQRIGEYQIAISVNLTSSGVKRVFNTRVNALDSDFKLSTPPIAGEPGVPLGNVLLGKVSSAGWNPPWAGLTGTARQQAKDAYNPNTEFYAVVRWEGTSQNAMLRVNDSDELEIYSDHTFSTVGQKHVFVEAGHRDLPPLARERLTVNIVNLSWTFTDIHRTNGLGEGHSVSTGPSGLGNADVLVGTGDIRLTHPVDLDASPGSDVSGNPELVYDSGTVNVRPIIEGQLSNAITAIKPTSVAVRLWWNGKPTDWTTWSWANYVDTSYSLAAQFPDPVAHSGIYDYQIQTKLIYDNAVSPVTFTDTEIASTTQYPGLLVAKSGKADILVRDRKDSDYVGKVFDDLSAWGKGWSLSSAPRLILEENNDLLWADSYGARRWTMDQSDRTVWDNYRKSTNYKFPTIYPVNQNFSGGVGIVTFTADKPEFGELSLNLATLEYTYKGLQNVKYRFNHLGLLTKIEQPGTNPFEFKYDTEGTLDSIKTPDIRTAGANASTFDLQPNGSSALITQFGGRVVTLSIDGGFVTSIASAGDLIDRSFVKGIDEKIGTQDWDGSLLSVIYGSHGDVSSVQVGSLSQFEIHALSTNAFGSVSPYTLVPGRSQATVKLPMPSALSDRESKFELDAQSRILKQTKADGTVLEWTRRPDHLVGAYTDGRGLVTTYDYLRGQVTSIIAPDQGTQTYTYDSNDLLTSYTWPQSDATISTTYTYNADQLLKTETNGLGGVTTYEYEADYDLDYMLDPLNNKTDFTNDAYGRVTVVQDALSHYTVNVYDSNGNVDLTVDALNRAWEVQYDARNRLRSEQSEITPATFYEYKAYGSLKQTTTPRGIVNKNIYSSAGLVSASYAAYGMPEQQLTSFEYHADQTIWKVTDAFGLVTTTVPDPAHRKAKVSLNFEGRWTETNFDANGNAVGSINDLGDSTSAEYDGANRIKKQVAVDPAVQTTFEYYADGQVKKTTDPVGIVTTYKYNALRQPTEVKVGNDVTSYPEYDVAGNLKKMVDAVGLETRYEYDPLNRIKLTKYFDSYDSRFYFQSTEYDAVGNVEFQSAMYEPGQVSVIPKTKYEYDKANRLVQVFPADPVTGAPVANEALGTTTTYYPDGLVKRTTSPIVNGIGARTFFENEYDGLDRVIKVTDNEHFSSTKYSFAAPKKVEATDKRGNTTTYEYDLLDRPTKITQPAPGAGASTHGAPVTSFDYFRAIRTEMVTDPVGFRTKTVYDNMGRADSVYEWPSGLLMATLVQNNDYYLDGSLQQSVDRFGNTTTYLYDRLNHVTETMAPNLDGIRVDKQKFDAAGKLVKFDVGMNYADTRITQYVYDTLGRQREMVDPLGAIQDTSYDGYGRLGQTTDRTGKKVQYLYDYQGRKTDEIWKDASGAPTGETLKWEYFAAGNIKMGQVTSTTPSYSNTLSIDYDSLGRDTMVTTRDAGRTPFMLGYQYDLNGNRTHLDVKRYVATNSLYSMTYLYDALNRMYNMSQTASVINTTSTNVVNPKAAEIVYLADNRLSTIARYEDVSTTGVNIPATFTNYAYTPFKQIESIQHFQGLGTGGTILSSQTNTWNNFNLIATSKATNGYSPVVTTYENYADQQLKSEVIKRGSVTLKDTKYFWDHYGNPTQDPSLSSLSPYKIGGDDRLLEDGKFKYEYDENGSLIKKTAIVAGVANGPYEEYTWNHHGKMKTAKAYTASGTLQWSEEYRYDAANRNSSTIHTDAGATPKTNYSVYDGFDMYTLLMEVDETDHITMSAFHGPAVDMVLAEDRLQYDGSGNVTGHDVQWPLGDHQNSANAIAKSNASGVASIASEIVRGAFGDEVDKQGTAKSEFGFQGQVANDATGQGQFRNRNFSAQQGRFISQDPIQFASGQTNHYQFVRNHPHLGTDPSGLDEVIFKNKLDDQKKSHVYDVIPKGRNGDFSQANALARAKNSLFVDEKSVGGTWHHVSFDPKTGMMKMQLVDYATHAANGHSGGYSQWLDWVAETIEGGDYKSLSAAQKTALMGVFKDAATFDDLSAKLANRGIISKIAKKTDEGILHAKFFKGKQELASIATETRARTLLRVAKEYGGSALTIVAKGGKKLVAPGIVVFTAGSVFANGGDGIDAAVAIARDEFEADLVEKGFEITVVAGCNIIASEMVKPVRFTEKKYQILDAQQKRELTDYVKERYSNLEKFSEFAPDIRVDQAQKVDRAIGSFLDSLKFWR